MSKKVKYIILLTIFFILTNIVMYNILEINKQNKINIALDSHLTKLEIQYKTLMYHWRVTADAAYKSTSSMQKVINILSKTKTASIKEKMILRKQLYSKLKNKYKALKTKGVYQFGFILPDKTAFLRMHRPEKFGDDVGKSYRVKYVSKFKRSAHGYEKGKITPAFRNAFPLFSKSSTNTSDKNNNYLGSMEISFSSDTIQKYFNNVSKIDTHFLIHKDIFNTRIWKEYNFDEKFIVSKEHPKYMLSIMDNIKNSISSKITLNSIKEDIYKNVEKEKKFRLYTNYKNKTVVVSFFPIRDIQDKNNIAWIVSYENDHFIDLAIQNTKTIYIGVFLILLILFYFIYKNLNHKLELEIEIKNKTKDLKRLNETLEQKIIEEVAKSKDIEKKLFQSEKLASMGEMIGNIAHQWRQPLSVISTASTGIIMQKEFGTIDEKGLIQTCHTINDNAQYLSKTIDDFRNFIKGNRTKKLFNLNDDIDSFLHLVEGSIKTHHISIVLDLDKDINIVGYENELIQCLINIFNNAKDILIERNIEDKLIFISTTTINDKALIKIKDNGEGIPKDIIKKIFEPYFTTKHKSQGTGLGLHMTHNLIVDGMNGTVAVSNQTYTYKDKKYIGAEFIISLPM